MKFLLFCIMLFSLLTNPMCAQTWQYLFEDKNMEKPAKESNAHYIMLVEKSHEGTYSTRLFDIQTREEITYPGKRIGEPTLTDPKQSIDFNFPLNYTDTFCKSDTYPVSISFNQDDIDSIGYKGFKLKGKKSDLGSFLARNLRYPEFAKEFNIQGKVTIQFTLTKEGTVQDFVVKKSVHPSLDKEAIRVLKMIKMEKLPTINGEFQNICYTVPINFRME